MPLGSTLRFDRVPLDIFLPVLDEHERDVRQGFLPRASSLKEVMVEGRWTPPEGGFEGPLSVYLLQETDALSQRSEAFVILHTTSGGAFPLRSAGIRLRDALERKRITSLFRIDPKYGLLCGSASETVDPLVKWDRPGCYVALYLTSDAASPALALMEYVPSDQQQRYRDLFLKYNRIQPVKQSFFQNTWQKLKGKPAEEPATRRLTYGFIKQLLLLVLKESVTNTSISLIYKDMDQAEAKSVKLGQGYATYSPTGNDRFFASLGELA